MYVPRYVQNDKVTMTVTTTQDVETDYRMNLLLITPKNGPQFFSFWASFRYLSFKKDPSRFAISVISAALMPLVKNFLKYGQ